MMGSVMHIYIYIYIYICTVLLFDILMFLVHCHVYSITCFQNTNMCMYVNAPEIILAA